MTKQKKRSAKKVAQILERGTKILELRKNGASLRQISAILTKQAKDKGEPTRGYSYEQVRKDWLEIIQLCIDEQQDTVEEIRSLCSERLDKVMLHMFPLLRSGDSEEKARAANAIIRANREYAELYGAKRPLAVEVSNPDGTPLIPKNLSVTINSIYDDGGDPSAGNAADDTDSEASGDAPRSA